MTDIAINGNYFTTSTGPVDLAAIELSDTDGGPITETLLVYNPSGANSGSTTPGITINTWSETLIDISHSLSQSKLVANVVLTDDPQTFSVAYDLNPDEAQSAPAAFAFSYNGGTDELTITSAGGYLQPIADDPSGVTNANFILDGTANAVPFSVSLRAYDFNSIDNFSAVLGFALSWFGTQPVEITAATMYDASFAVTASWTGSYIF